MGTRPGWNLKVTWCSMTESCFVRSDPRFGGIYRQSKSRTGGVEWTYTRGVVESFVDDLRWEYTGSRNRWLNSLHNWNASEAKKTRTISQAFSLMKILKKSFTKKHSKTLESHPHPISPIIKAATSSLQMMTRRKTRIQDLMGRIIYKYSERVRLKRRRNRLL